MGATTWRDERTGYDCAVVVRKFAICGYVEVPADHPLYRCHYDSPPVRKHVTHLTFSGLPEDVAGHGRDWWFGIDDNGAGSVEEMRAWVEQLAHTLAEVPQ